MKKLAAGSFWMEEWMISGSHVGIEIITSASSVVSQNISSFGIA